MKISKNKWKRINEILRNRFIDPSQFKHIDCVRIHPTESEEHFIAKAKECFQLYKRKHHFLTESWTINGKKRYDILDLTDDNDIEIEKSKSKKKYKGDKEIIIK